MKSYKCHECGGELRETTVERDAQLKHDGSEHPVSARVPARKCDACGALSFDYRADDLLRDALRVKLGLLNPSEIGALCDRYSLKQKDVAEAIRIAPETLSRWMRNHVLQSASHDKLLRYFFAEKELELTRELTPVATGEYEPGRVRPRWDKDDVVVEADCSATEPQYALAA